MGVGVDEDVGVLPSVGRTHFNLGDFLPWLGFANYGKPIR